MEFTTYFELQSQATRLKESVSYAKDFQGKTGVSPSMLPCSKGLNPKIYADNSFNRLQFAIENFYRDFKLELIPLQSPLLGESLLVSFPPLSYMLKFSGSSYLISGPQKKKI